MASLSFPVLLIFAGLALCRPSRPVNAWCLVVLRVGGLLGLWATILYWFIDGFTGEGINQAALFHLREAINFGMIIQFWWIGLVVLILLVLTGWILWGIKKDFQKEFPLCWRGGVAVFAVLMGIGLHPAIADVNSIVYTMHKNSGPDWLGIELEKQSDMVEPVSPSSFVYVYMESLDQEFFDEKKFPGLLPELKQLIKEGGHIEGLRQVPYTGWTAAGMHATQCGLPMISENLLRDTGVECLGNVLKKNNYFLSYMGGADLAFAGKGDFYRRHGFDEVLGKDDLDTLAGRELEHSQWGVFDDDLFDLAQVRIKNLASQHERFGFFLLTLDTHGPLGHETPACRGLRYASGESEILNAAHCADRLISKFVKKLLKSDHMANVAIILSSDHLMASNDAGIPSESRRSSSDRSHNTFIFFNSAREKNGPLNRSASMLDVGPTLLHLVGFDVSTMGFGRNLFHPRETLVEQFGANEFSRLVEVWRNTWQENLGRGRFSNESPS
jgi:phosphoglycerol transferase